ncbi:Sugar lactone lactonase YvrE [Monaibacterium marinum]|uniref:Sugar lactone lactonase YvrE n=1 Tax=Pontivivens marinum TaxID=1690039 RepID=A0A2C9CSB0_9RHOB|nr:SMP-30/gluconolactonase/LRE family protein [Monaibacterium marinum]SOH94246.1 Sugar lactone lactonase YvrE [Monaibacterium marinum]
MAELFDPRLCQLGEGPLWHPARDELFWFDILSNRLYTPSREWSFDRAHSAAGWIDADTMLIASDTALWSFDIESGTRTHVAPLEAENPLTRSNDGRADMQGGFWIGTMGWNAEQGAGAIYRYYRGELRQLFGGITISNSICFSPDGTRAYFADTAADTIWTCALDAQGWPIGERQVFVGDVPGCDGAICDGDGYIWSARWGIGQVVRHAPHGGVDHIEHVPAPQVTCPALTPDGVLYATTAYDGLDLAALEAAPLSGAVFRICEGVPARVEPRVIL